MRDCSFLHDREEIRRLRYRMIRNVGTFLIKKDFSHSAGSAA